MIFKVFEKFGIDLSKHISSDFGDFKAYTLKLGDFDSQKYKPNANWDCIYVVTNKNIVTITGYIPSYNFNSIE